MMHSRYKILAALAALAFAVTPSLAADYDPPIFIEEAPEYVPVEIGSGWYLRGDVSYDLSSRPYDVSINGVAVDNYRFGGGVGFGYHFTDELRADLTVSYLGKDSLSSGANELSQTMWSGLVSGYYDIATIVGITPYVGAGIGATYAKQEVNLTSGTFDSSDYEFAYALMAGASYKVTDNVSIDAGYQFLHTPDMRYYDVDTDTVRKGDKKHLIRVGLRYDLW
jgi:opacity protein-like surface antigen